MPPELLRLWCEEFWISDAGAIAEAEFNLVPDDELVTVRRPLDLDGESS